MKHITNETQRRARSRTAKGRLLKRGVSHPSKIVTNSLGFRLEVSIAIENIEGRGQHKTYECDGAIREDVGHKITIASRLRDDELAEVIAHEAYHLFESVKPLIKVDEETQAIVFGQLVARIHAAARMANGGAEAQPPETKI